MKNILGTIVFVAFFVAIVLFAEALETFEIDYRANNFWAKYPGNDMIISGGEGMRNEEQQASQIEWFCGQTKLQAPQLGQNYTSVQQCEDLNLAAFKEAKKEIRLVRNFPDYEETIGYGCMANAVWDNCSKPGGFCHWNAVMEQYNTCIDRHI
jgi:hypothetical protein